jgi:tellurite resistance protein TerC
MSSIASPTLWFVTIGVVLALLVVDFIATRRPHEVSMKEAIGWSAFYVALPLAYTGYLVEKTLSVDNLFVFMLLLAAFAVPEVLKQRVLLYGIIGALVLRGIFIALGAAALSRFDWVFLVFGAILLLTGVKLLRDAIRGQEHEVDVAEMRVVKVMRRFMPVADDYEGTRFTVMQKGRRALTPLALVTVAVLATDVVFAVDSVPAVYGITGDPYLVFVTNAFALLGLRALYFVLEGALGALRHLSYGLAAILGFIGAKLVLHWAHLVWPSVPDVPTLTSLFVIVGILGVTIATSLWANKRDGARAADAGAPDDEPEVVETR